MVAEIVVLAGPAGTGKTSYALERYQQVADRGAEPGYLLWIAPNWRAVEELRRKLLSNRVGYLAPGIMTFDRFAEAVVEFSGPRSRLLDRWMQRWLIWQLVEERREAGKLRYFAQIAQTPGFLDMLCHWIQELKRREIWPEQFLQACQAKGMTDKDQELFDLYQAYQRMLTEHDLYDAEGRFWLARTLLAQGALLPPAQHQSLELVVVDGFTDFTRTQHEILEHLASRAKQILITLLLEKEPGREELFAKPQKTLQELRRRHQQLQLQWLDRPTEPVWVAMDHIERLIFANPCHYQPLTQKAERIEILATASQLGEVELLAKRIKQLLTQGEPNSRSGPVRPDEILVLFRSLKPVAPLVQEVFRRYGIPFAVESALPLGSARSLRALVELMQLVVEDWPFRRLLAVLQHSYFQPDWPQWHQGRAGMVAEQIIRRLQISQGRQLLLQTLQRLADSQGPDASPAKATLALLKQLAQTLDQLPERATLSGWAKAWQQLARQLGIRQASPTQPVGFPQPTQVSSAGNGVPSLPHPTAEELAWQHLEQLLESADQLCHWVGRSPPQLNLKQALAVLTDLLQQACLPFQSQEAGRVRVLSVWTARPLRARYVFLAGLSEKSFPLPESADQFYTEQEIQQLIQQKLPLSARRDRTCEEMLLFYEAMSRANRQLVLSYPGLDESAQPLAPSPYLDELEAVCGPDRIDKKEVFELRPIPAEPLPLCARDFRLRALADALEGKVELLAGLLQAEALQQPTLPAKASSSSRQLGKKRTRTGKHSPSAPMTQALAETSCPAEEAFGIAENLLAAIQLIADRSQIDHFGPGEGILASPAVLLALQQKEFPPEHVYAATALEQYAQCPFRFFLEQLLQLSPVEDLTLQEDLKTRGLLTHQILAHLHRQLNEQLGPPASPNQLPDGQWQTLLNQLLDKTFAHTPQEPVLAAFWKVHRCHISQWLANYRQQYQTYEKAREWASFDQKPTPTYFEIAFGQSESLGPEDHGLLQSKRPADYGPLELCLPQAAQEDLPKVRISGRIDRIDLAKVADCLVFNVLDYKTGKASWPRNSLNLHQQLDCGLLLQLPLYLLAVEQVILADQKALPWFAGYWRLTDNARASPLSGFYASNIQTGMVSATETWQTIRSRIIPSVFRLVRNLRSGQFPVYNPDPNCTRNCPWKTACRIQQIRALKKTWPPLPSADQ
ncbi:MAG: PD-(D/E)XK nuclease family protein [Thermoguttaceae bacterium]|nr:PD-(D/E)XK nuclease family protein [Thermoguttaceae bacterium]MDW8037710.1 PD-(D/E)XK nuclease family protein [Thermoguttaceae bacterium]